MRFTYLLAALVAAQGNDEEQEVIIMSPTEDPDPPTMDPDIAQQLALEASIPPDNTSSITSFMPYIVLGMFIGVAAILISAVCMAPEGTFSLKKKEVVEEDDLNLAENDDCEVVDITLGKMVPAKVVKVNFDKKTKLKTYEVDVKYEAETVRKIRRPGALGRLMAKAKPEEKARLLEEGGGDQLATFIPQTAAPTTGDDVTPASPAEPVSLEAIQLEVEPPDGVSPESAAAAPSHLGMDHIDTEVLDNNGFSCGYAACCKASTVDGMPARDVTAIVAER